MRAVGHAEGVLLSRTRLAAAAAQVARAGGRLSPASAFTTSRRQRLSGSSRLHSNDLDNEFPLDRTRVSVATLPLGETRPTTSHGATPIARLRCERLTGALAAVSTGGQAVAGGSRRKGDVMTHRAFIRAIRDPRSWPAKIDPEEFHLTRAADVMSSHVCLSFVTVRSSSRDTAAIATISACCSEGWTPTSRSRSANL